MSNAASSASSSSWTCPSLLGLRGRKGRRSVLVAQLLAAVALLAWCPAALAANVYVSSFASGVVSPYSVAADGTLVALSPATVPSGTGSQAIVLSPDRTSVYVANNSANTVAQFSVGADGTLSPKTPPTVAVTRPVGAAVSPDGKSAYFTSQTSSLIAQFDIAADGTLSPKTPATIAAPANQGDIVVNAASTRAYAGNTGGTVSQYAIAADGTLSSLTPATVMSGGNQSTGLGLSPDGSHLYVANRGANSVSWMAIGSGDGTLTLAGTIAAQAQPNDVTLSPDGHSAYAANQNGAANSLSQYTVAADGSLTSKLPAVIASPTTPKTIVFSSDGTNAYVPHQNSADVGMFTVAGDGTLTAKSPATVASATGAFAAVYSDGPPVTTSPPSATTGAASAITDTGATVAGTVNAHGVATNYTFEYGTSTSFGAISPISSAGSASTDVAQTADLTGLSPNTTYYYRLVASSSAGDAVGTVHTFKTTATLHGQVNPSGQQTAFTFEYGTTTSFGAITTVVALDDADVLEPVTATLTGLAPDTTYYYRVVAANATGTTSGAVLRFSTGPGGLPAVTTGVATDVSASGATLAGTVDAHGAQTAFAFEYGTTTAFGSLSAVDNAGDSNAVQQITLPISGLSPGTTYLYRLIATNPNGTTSGDVHSFTTTG
jgi:6-phosphogluconolactonase (cycloisomerase 2 family)